MKTIDAIGFGTVAAFVCHLIGGLVLVSVSNDWVGDKFLKGAAISVLFSSVVAIVFGCYVTAKYMEE